MGAGGKRLPRPNRLTSAFRIMRKECPDAIAKYAMCVDSKHAEGQMNKGDCEREFRLVKACFKKVIQRI